MAEVWRLMGKARAAKALVKTGRRTTTRWLIGERKCTQLSKTPEKASWSGLLLL